MNSTTPTLARATRVILQPFLSPGRATSVLPGRTFHVRDGDRDVVGPCRNRNASTSSSPSVKSINSPISSSYPSTASSSSSSLGGNDNAPWTLPEIKIRQTHPWRYKSHYDDVLSEDLMYMLYDHPSPSFTTTSTTTDKARAQPAGGSGPSRIPTPYEANRPPSAPRGNRPLKPSSSPITAHGHSLPRLESITLHTMVKEAIGNKPALLNAIMALRSIGGVTQRSMGHEGNEGVQVVVSKSGAAAFKLRAGMPVAVKVKLTGEPMYTFLSTLLEFVLPRLREYPPLLLPPSSSNTSSPSSLSGIISFGFPPEAMALFPQIEGNLDSYSRMHGFHVTVETGRRGKGAQDAGRTLLSGFRVPFGRK